MTTKHFNLIGLVLAIVLVSVFAAAYAARPSGANGLQTTSYAGSGGRAESGTVLPEPVPTTEAPRVPGPDTRQTQSTGGPALHVDNPNTAPGTAAYSEKDIRAYVASEQGYFTSIGARSSLTVDSVQFMTLGALASKVESAQGIKNSPDLLVCVVIMSGPFKVGDGGVMHVMQVFDAHNGNMFEQAVYK